MGFDLQAHQELRRLSYTVNCLVRDFCCRAKKCIGISNTGDPNLVLNQQGNWIPLRFITSYTALTSTIDFTNNGGDDWDVTFKITPDNTQLPSGVTIVDYDYIVDFWNSGVQTPLQNADNVNIDTSVNVGSNGAGVYSLQQHYNLSDGTNLHIWDLIKVDASGNVLDYVKLNGTIVNSVNGLTVNVTANMTQSQSYPVEWAASPSFSTIGSGVSASLSVPIGSNYILYGVVLGAEFSDFNLPFGIFSSSVVIS